MKKGNHGLTVLFFLIVLVPLLMAEHECIGSAQMSASSRKAITIRIYNDNFAFVSEVREVALPAGISELRFAEIPERINPASVRIRTLSSTGGVEILDQNYEYDLVTPQNLMDHYVGKKVKLLEKDDFSGAKGELTAELLSNAQGPVYRIGDEIHIGHPGRVVLPKLPDDLVVIPSLLWRLSAPTAATYTLEVSYLTEDAGWEADYSIILNNENTRGDLYGWVTIKNNAGFSFEHARIQLLAGKVARVKELRLMRLKEAEDRGGLGPGVTEERIFEYHLYDLPEDITVKERQIKQVRLFSAERIPIKKELRYYGGQQYYRHKLMEEGQTQRVGVYLEFENRKTFHLGIPLPEGIMRVFKADSKGSLQFLGEDRINHTPEDEKVRVQTGYSSDLVVERRQVDWRKPSPDTLEVSWEIIIRNQKDEAAWIAVMESVPGDWEIMESSHQWKKEEASTLRFDLSIVPKTEETIRYRVRTKI